MMKSLVVLGGGAIMVAIAVGAVSPASAITNQDNTNLCASPAYQNAPAHFVDCQSAGRVGGRLGHKTVYGLAQTHYPLAIPTTSAPAPPTPQNLCAAPSTKPCGKGKDSGG
jgi:hypothetical protein